MLTQLLVKKTLCRMLHPDNLLTTFYIKTDKKYALIFGEFKKSPYLCIAKQNKHGAIAQLVEQRTENPCVPGSIPGGTT